MKIGALAMARRLLVLCPYPEGTAAGQRLKFEQYYDNWREAGIEVTVAPFMDLALWRVLYEPGHRLAKAAGLLRGYLRRLRQLVLVRRHDAVLVHMWVTPLGGTLAERLLRKLTPHLIYDLEDNIILARPPQVNPVRRFLAPLVDRTRKVRWLIANADAVIVASPFMEEPCRALTKGRVHLIPPSLDTDRVRPATAPRGDGPVVIGWTGTFSSRIYLDLLSGAFRRLAERVPFRLRVIGNFDYDLPGVDLDVVRWTAEREAKDLQGLDIGVYPLVDDEWSRGKAGLKIIQYQAAGLPCVASDVPLSREQLRDGETGFLVSSEDEWVDRLEQLVRDADLRARMGAAGRKDAVAGYSQAVIAGRYRAALADVIGQAGGERGAR
ncbi:MAG: glycosyltransferase family 4 protein [Novosphingobium sp.]